MHWESRAGEPTGETSPEELIAAALASDYSQCLAHKFEELGKPARWLNVTASMSLDKVTDRYQLTGIHLEVVGSVPSVDDETFGNVALRAERECFVSRALSGVCITIRARPAGAQERDDVILRGVKHPRKMARQQAIEVVEHVLTNAPTPVGRKTEDHWTGEFFDETFWAFAKPVYSAQQTRREVDFLIQVTKARSGWRCLDLACGRGRHDVLLAQAGLAVTAVDINRRSIDIATAVAAQEEVNVEFVHADMREFVIQPRAYDLIVVLQNSFGFFTDVENYELLCRARRGLRPGGYLYLDIANWDYLRPRLTPRTWHRRDGGLFLLEQQYDYVSGVMTESLQMYDREAVRRPPRVSHLRMYGTGDSLSLFRLAGLDGIRAFGSFEQRAPTTEDRYIQILGHAPLT
jgi:organic hydroperoxide reductase OsmC/OhrA/SAM-dependent methyltransferase